MEECHQNDLSVSDKSGTLSSATYLLEISPCNLLTIATKGFLQAKNTLKI